ncbi:MAG TPA: purine-nucleoside phosphorylase [Candidatus Eisenbacteria bacterium]|nr:purine-nucleoside phosphorylase [Candidatus Eisenbacteria bacterium]
MLTHENMTDHFTLADNAAQLIFQRTPFRPTIGLVLGSGLGAFADSLTEALRVPYSDIPSFPQSTAIGHAGRMVIGKAGDVAVAAMQGRVHQYEGYSAQQVAFPIRVFARMGVKSVILTNAAGGINLSYSQGALVLLRDHINLQGTNPLVGSNDDRFGVRFPDMTHTYSRAYRQIAREEAAKLNITMHEGIYAALLGPSYETPTEIEYLRRIGADLVGMSTVAEVIAARHMGLNVLAISCVTNMAAGVIDQPLSHAEVMETGERVRGIFEALLKAVLPRIAREAGS